MPEVSHRGPNPGVVAVVFVILKNASLFPVTIFGVAGGFKPPYFPVVTAPPDQIVAYFSSHAFSVSLLAFFQFGSTIPLGLFTACVVSRLRFLVVRAAGAHTTLFGGLAAAFDSAAAAFVLSVLAMSGVAQDGTLVRALHLLAFDFGGPGYAVPTGLLTAGVSVTAGTLKLLPRWIVVLGLLLAVAGELSWFAMMMPAFTFLIPLTRFPGFIWLIAAGFALPASVTRIAEPSEAEVTS